MIYKHLLTYLLTYLQISSFPLLFWFDLKPESSRRLNVLECCAIFLLRLACCTSRSKGGKKPYLLIQKMKSVAQDEVCGAGSELY